MDITRGHQSDLSRARAIYDWIVEHTIRDPDVRGCGLGDIRWMLETKNLAGKCDDLNALFVGLARASGIPARDLYGLRVAPSTRFTSLGRGGDVTAAQHCRAEVHLQDFGWVPVDPADVRKVILEERPGGTLTDAHVIEARERLFGSWEMNWIAFSDAHDVVLPGSAGPPRCHSSCIRKPRLAACAATASSPPHFAIASPPPPSELDGRDPLPTSEELSDR